MTKLHARSKRTAYSSAPVFLIIALLSLVEPLTHVWIMYAPPESAVHTGMHIGDSAHHLLSMRSFEDNFFSPFVTCKAEEGPRSIRYFMAPLFLLYGMLGEIGRLLRIHEFLFLGLANGAGGALYLFMVYRLFTKIDPKHARTAFYIFALGGGLGGAAFALTGIFGLHGSPHFEQWFQRFAWYELIEGQHLSPLLLMPRFYYTLPLAIGLGALIAFIESDRNACPRHIAFSAFLLAVATALNMRLGPMIWLIAMLYAMAASIRPLRFRMQRAATFTAGLITGGLVSWLIIRQHPSYAENVTAITHEAMRLLPFLSATLLLWLALTPALRQDLKASAGPLRYVVFALSGYLIAYAILYCGYQAFYGNWLFGGDTSAAIAVSDWALAGALLGFAVAWKRSRSTASGTRTADTQWLSLWLLLFIALAVSAWGGGWYLQFTPQRWMILIGPPMPLLAARGIALCTPRAGRMLLSAILGCGLLSIAVSALFFQGDLGQQPGQGPFAYLHYAHMTKTDAELLDKLPGGTVLVPGWSPIAFGEIISLREGMQVLGGPGAMNLGDQPLAELQHQINTFFQEGTPNAERRHIAEAWCVQYVYCPDTCPVDAALLKELASTPWLKSVASAGKGRVFAVNMGV